jgi:hypothetical protein
MLTSSDSMCAAVIASSSLRSIGFRPGTDDVSGASTTATVTVFCASASRLAGHIARTASQSMVTNAAQ